MRLIRGKPRLLLAVAGLLNAAVCATAVPRELRKFASLAKVEDHIAATESWLDGYKMCNKKRDPSRAAVPFLSQLSQSLVHLTMEFWDWAGRETPDQETFRAVGLYFQSIIGEIEKRYCIATRMYRLRRRNAMTEPETPTLIEKAIPNIYNSLWRPLMAYYEFFHLLGPAISPAAWKLIEAKNGALALLMELSGAAYLGYDESGTFRLPDKDAVESMVRKVAQTYEHYVMVWGQFREAMDSAPVYDYIFEPTFLEMCLPVKACRFYKLYHGLKEALGNPWAEEDQEWLDKKIRRVLLGLEGRLQGEMARGPNFGSETRLEISLGRHYRLEREATRLEESIVAAENESFDFTCKLLSEQAPAWYHSGVQRTKLQELAHHLLTLPDSNKSRHADKMAQICRQYLDEAPIELPIENLHPYLSDVTERATELIHILVSTLIRKTARHRLELTVLLRQYYFLAIICRPIRAAAELYPLPWTKLRRLVNQQIKGVRKFRRDYCKVSDKPTDKLAELVSKGGPLPALVNIGTRVLHELAPIEDLLISYPLPVCGSAKRAQ